MDIQAWLHHASSMGEQALAVMGVLLAMYLANRSMDRRALARKWGDDEQSVGSSPRLPANRDAEPTDPPPGSAAVGRT